MKKLIQRREMCLHRTPNGELTAFPKRGTELAHCFHCNAVLTRAESIEAIKQYIAEWQKHLEEQTGELNEGTL